MSGNIPFTSSWSEHREHVHEWSVPCSQFLSWCSYPGASTKNQWFRCWLRPPWYLNSNEGSTIFICMFVVCGYHVCFMTKFEFLKKLFVPELSGIFIDVWACHRIIHYWIMCPGVFSHEITFNPWTRLTWSSWLRRGTSRSRQAAAIQISFLRNWMTALKIETNPGIACGNRFADLHYKRIPDKFVNKLFVVPGFFAR